MRIALVTARTLQSAYDEPHLAVSKSLIIILEQFNFDVLVLSQSKLDFMSLAESIKPSLLVLTGGEDIGVDKTRDSLEIELLKYAEKTKIPSLGICRGMQVMAKFLGSDIERKDGHVAINHVVQSPDNSSSFVVNSYHNFSVKNLSKDLLVNYVSLDGTIESISHRQLPWLGVMWHPERDGNDPASEDFLAEFLSFT